MPDVSLPVDAQGKLRIDAPTGRSLELTAEGDILWLELPGWPEARALMRASLGARAQTLARLGKVLGRHGLMLSLESSGKPVFQLGHGVPPNWFARLLGLGPARVPLSAVALLFRR